MKIIPRHAMPVFEGGPLNTYAKGQKDGENIFAPFHPFSQDLRQLYLPKLATTILCKMIKQSTIVT